MRKVVYLTVFLVVLLLGAELLRKFYLAESPALKFEIPSIASVIGVGGEKESFPIGEYLSAIVAQDDGDFEQSIKYFEKALLADTKNRELMNKLYGLYIYEGQLDDAIDLAERHKALDDLEKVVAKDKDVIPYLLLALDKYSTGKTREVPQYLEDLADPVIPDSSHIDGVVMPLLLAWSYAVEEDYKNSFRVIDTITSSYMLSVFSYNRALINDIANNKPLLINGKQHDPKEKSKMFMADIFFEIGNYSKQSANLEEAVIYYRLAMFLDPEVYKLRKSLANAFELQGKTKYAIDVYSKTKEDSPFYNENMLALALAYHRDEQNGKAEKVLLGLSEAEGYKFQSKFALGTIEMTRKNYEKAIKCFNEAILDIEDFGPDHWNIYFNLGVAYDRVNDWKNAERNLKKSVQLFPENPEVLNYLAYSWIVKNKNIKQARQMLEAAVIRSGGAPHILDSYGWALYKLGMYKEALPFLEQAALALPYNSVINDHLAELYLKTGRKTEAKYHWNKAINYFDEESAEEVTLEDIKNKFEKNFGG